VVRVKFPESGKAKQEAEGQAELTLLQHPAGKILTMKRFGQRIVLAFALICLPATAQAQPFPTGPISVVVPLAPSDAADIAALRGTPGRTSATY